MSSSLFIKNNYTFKDWSAWSDTETYAFKDWSEWSDSARKFLFNNLSSHKDYTFEIKDSNRFHCQGFRLAVWSGQLLMLWDVISLKVGNWLNHQ